MATPKGLIDNAISYYDDAEPDEAQNAKRRARLLLFLQHIYDYVWNYREWEFTYKEGAALVVLANGNNVALPTEYMEFSKRGSVFDTARRIRLQEVSIHLVERMRNELSSASGGGVLNDGFAVSQGKIQLPYTVSSNTSLVPFYRIRAETLVDDTTPMLIPDKYANLVLLPGLVVRTQESKQDARETWGKQFVEGLSQMCMLEQPQKSAVRRLPLHTRGAW